MVSAALVGTAAACLTTGSWLPQIVRTYRFRSALDLSWLWLITVGLGQALWLAYGVTQDDAPLVLANAVSLSLVLGLSSCKLVSDRLITEPVAADLIVQPAQEQQP